MGYNKKNKKNGYRYENHSYKTRRDFLAQGFTTGLTYSLAPSILSQLVSRGYAEEECQVGGGGGANRVAFVTIDLAGGGSIAGGNILVGGAGGQEDHLPIGAHVTLSGLPAEMTPDKSNQIRSDFGILFHQSSQMYAGMMEKTSQDARQKTDGMIMAARSENDTDTNVLNAGYGIYRSGLFGEFSSLAGTRNTTSGGRSKSPENMLLTSVSPTIVTDPATIPNLVGVPEVAETFNQQDFIKIMKKVESLSDEKLLRINESQAAKEILSCTYRQTTDLVERFGDPTTINPLLDPDLVTGPNPIFTSAEVSDGEFRKAISMIFLAVNRHTGSATIELGGFDYHNGTRATGEARDNVAGRIIGATIEYAHRKGVALCLNILSDGGVFSNGAADNNAGGKMVWTGDRASSAANVMLVVNSAGSGRPGLTSSNRQIGHYSSAGAVEASSSIVGNNILATTEVVVLNYLALHGEIGLLDQVLPSNILPDGNDLSQLVKFEPLSQIG